MIKFDLLGKQKPSSGPFAMKPVQQSRLRKFEPIRAVRARICGLINNNFVSKEKLSKLPENAAMV
jgi:hypothetical protein